MREINDPYEYDVLDKGFNWQAAVTDPEIEPEVEGKYRGAAIEAAGVVVKAMRGDASRLQFDAARSILERVVGKPKVEGSEKGLAKQLERLLDAGDDAFGG